MKKITDRQKLDVIDYLCAEMECDAKIGSKLGNFAGDIYKITHPHKECRHLDWERETLEFYKHLKDDGII